MAQLDFTTPGADDWTVPPAVNSVKLILIGGGGQGDASDDGGGGGGGAYLDVVLTVSPGTTYDFSVGSAANNTNWESGEYIAGGGSNASGTFGGAGGTVSGSELPADNTSDGGAGGSGSECCGDVCDSCTCDNPPDCTSSSCASSHNECADYGSGGGSSGTLLGSASGGSASCGGGGGDCGGTPYPGDSGTDGTGGQAPDDPGGSGGSAGQNGQAPGGGGGNNANGATGLVRLEWTPGNLHITTQPSNENANTNISPSPVVEVRYSSGSVATGYTGNVTATLTQNGEGATLSGTTTKAAVAGIATFNDLQVNISGTFTLTFTATDITQTESNFFTITGSINEVASGGVLVNKTCPPAARYNPSVTGGLLADKTCNAPAIYNIQASGGLLAGTSGSVSSRYNSLIPSGGVVIGGDSNPLVPISRKNLLGYWKLEDDESQYFSVGCVSEVGTEKLGFNGTPAGSEPERVAGKDNFGVYGQNIFDPDPFPGTIESAFAFGFSGTALVPNVRIDNKDWAMGFWFKADDWDGDKTLFTEFKGTGLTFYKGDSVTSVSVARLTYDEGDELFTFELVGRTATGVTSTTVSATNFGTPSVDVWHHFICWYDRTSQEIGISIDGQGNTASHTSGVNIPLETPQVLITSWGGTASQGLSGTVDELFWLERVLSEDERISLYAGGAGTFYDDWIDEPDAWEEFGHGGLKAAGQAAFISSFNGAGGQVANSTARLNSIYLNGTSGGVVCDGSAVVQVIHGKVATGGVVVDGTGLVTARFTNTATGGVVVAGSVVEDVVSTYSNSGSGGVVIGGTAVEDVINLYNVVATGGMVCGGVSRVVTNKGGVLVGTTGPHFMRFVTRGMKGVVVAGTAVDAHLLSPRGGIVCGGSATFEGSITHATATLSTNITISADDYQVVKLESTILSTNITIQASPRIHYKHQPSGGMVAGTSAVINSREAKSVTGGLVADGNSTVSLQNSRSTSGGQLANSTAVMNLRATQNGSGGLLAGTSAQVSSIETKSVSGGVVAGGTARVSIVTSKTATGGVELGTTFPVRLSHNIEAELATDITIVAEPTFYYLVNGAGGLEAAGVAFIGHRKDGFAFGGALAGGTAIVTMRHQQIATGGTLVNGTTRNTHQLATAISGGLVGAGAATLFKTYSNSGSGGLVAGTSASVNSREARTVSGGLVAGGQALAIRTIHATATLETNITIEAKAYQFIVDGLIDYLKPQFPTLGIYSLRQPERRPKNNVVITLITNNHWKGLRWAGGCAAGIADARLQLDVIGPDAISLAKQIIPLINGYRGQWGDCSIVSTGQLRQLDGDQFLMDGSPGLTRRRIIDIHALYRETRPVFAGTRFATTEDIETSLVTYLEDLAPVYHSYFGQTNRPAIAWKKTDEQDFYAIGEVMDFVEHEYSILIRAKTSEQCSTLANRVTQKLHGLTGQLNDTLCAVVNLENETQTYDLADVGSDGAYHFLEQTYRVAVEGSE